MKLTFQSEIKCKARLKHKQIKSMAKYKREPKMITWVASLVLAERIGKVIVFTFID